VPKRLIAKCADHWFAYTEMSQKRLLAMGIKNNLISVVNNTIDTKKLNNTLLETRENELLELRERLDISNNHVGLYCGGLYHGKRISFLLKSAENIRRQIPDFNLIVIGDGPEKEKIYDAANMHPWIKYIGAKYGADTVPYYRISRCLLMPGIVGLVIVNAIILQVPLVTTYNRNHSPEIAYLMNGINGLMTKNSIDDFVNGVCRCLTDDKLYLQLVTGCRNTSPVLTIEQMAEKFILGILKCLKR
jgi:glycosyltransferase involved in cell wall biosynthesis